ncbi:hypothetical protein LTR62_000974 [Meristemomyces frigidus]|uniref:Ubiquitin-activating enzyme E1-like n=1 Tax=Meristemomyces frigidus TaxID=1508187 RepID=A0AAN7YC17_9PEZI|nr:hypothetical protein LTR62_000974 [Meristemomyces frigidus]
MQRRDRGIAQSLGLPLTKRVKESRVLLVGAGGIGCEVLKNLVCSGFGSLPQYYGGEIASEISDMRRPEIVVVDMDTIDLSNLNRQFLFRKQHIKKYKALVAKETASQFNPSVNIDAQSGNIFDDKYDVAFFEGFDLVFNALDNLAARRHVNKMCLAADVPLIESGTTGFNGQVQAIKKGVTECYDCNPKPAQKSFPICTIRSTPSQPIHCIVWAKSYLFPELFGTSEEDSADVTVTEVDNVEEVAKLRIEAEALKTIRGLMGKSEFAQAVFDKVFRDDIERLRGMEEMWLSRRKPEVLCFEQFAPSMDKSEDVVERGRALAMKDQAIWSLAENLAVFSSAVDALSNRTLASPGTPLEFDKDDKDTLDFVASAANLRSHVFGIPLNSEWEIKQMAGNIIPAIATSNALTASLSVLEAFKIMRGASFEQKGVSKLTISHVAPTHNYMVTNGKEGFMLGGSKMVFLNSRSTERMITTQNLVPPQPDCAVCSPVYAKLRIPSNSSATLQDLVTLLQEKLGYEDFSIQADVGIIYDPDLEDNLEKGMIPAGYIKAGNGFLTVVDEGDEGRVDLVLSTSFTPNTTEADPESGLQLMPEEISLPSKHKSVAESNGQAMTTTEATGDASKVAAHFNAKRKRDAEEEVVGAKKRAKADEEVMVVEDDGAILLDD